MSNYIINVLGPITNSTVFIIALNYNNSANPPPYPQNGPYILAYNPIQSLYGWINYNLQYNQPLPTVGMFKTSVKNGKYYIYDTLNNNKYLTNDGNNLVLTDNISPININPVPNITAWNSPTIFLSGRSVPYNIRTPSDDFNIKFFNPVNNTTYNNVSTTLANVYLIPIDGWLGSVNPGPTQCSQVCSNRNDCLEILANPTTQSLSAYLYTQVNDCAANGTNGFVYCLNGDICGSGPNPCNGPCPKEYDICVNPNGGYKCTFDPELYIEGRYFLSNPIFWTVIGVIGAIILGFIILIGFLIYRKGASSE